MIHYRRSRQLDEDQSGMVSRMLLAPSMTIVDMVDNEGALIFGVIDSEIRFDRFRFKNQNRYSENLK